MTDKIVATVQSDLAARSAKGLAKYGHYVGDNPASHHEWLQHAYEEALDMAVYLKRAMMKQRPAEEVARLTKHPAYFTYCNQADAYYFAPVDRTSPPYKMQIHVDAIIDIAHDGTLAGIELIQTSRFKPPAAIERDRKDREGT